MYSSVLSVVLHVSISRVPIFFFAFPAHFNLYFLVLAPKDRKPTHITKS